MPRPVICVTGGDTRTTMALAALDAQLATGPLHAVTHLVCGGLEPSQPPRRTLKLLYALARGAWVLDAAWLLDSAAAKRLLPPEDFELREVLPGAERSRLAPQRTLAGLHISLRGQTSVPRDELARVLREAGAEVRSEDAPEGAAVEVRALGCVL